MIVVDANLIVYLNASSDFGGLAEAVLRRDPEWFAPPLWQPEVAHAFVRMVRAGMINADDAYRSLSRAHQLVETHAFADPVQASLDVLALALESGCTAYDCEYILTAMQLNTHLITLDKQLLQAFPETTRHPDKWLEETA